MASASSMLARASAPAATSVECTKSEDCDSVVFARTAAPAVWSRDSRTPVCYATTAMAVNSEISALSPTNALAGRHILLLGTTGFLAKVMLSLLLEHFGLRRVTCMIRGTRSKTPRDRLLNEVMTSEMMERLREKLGPAFDSIVETQIDAVSGDLGQPRLGLDDPTFDRLKGDVDVVINSAGLVNFNPALDAAVEANAEGALRVAELARDLGAKLVHVSTCYVAGARSGRVREEIEVGGFPAQDDMPGVRLDWRRELDDLARTIQQVKDRTHDAALEAQFRTAALERLEAEGREPHERTVRAAVTNQRRRWVAEEQIRLGLERAQHWGWTNIYTYSKALGEQAIADTKGLDWSIVRPAIVESAATYPFPGWNEGMNTTAPLAYLGLNGQVTYPGDNELILDVVPVDAVASATLAAAAGLIEGEHNRVYQVAAGDVNPCTMARTTTLVGLYKRRRTRAQMESGEISRLRGEWELRQEPHSTPRDRYERFSTPALKRWVGRARGVLERVSPEHYGPVGTVIARAQEKAQQIEEDLGKAVDAFELFMPFIWENRYVFITRNTRSLFERMPEAERGKLPYGIEDLDWRTYWLDIHLPGLEKWVFPKLDIGGPKRTAIPRDYRDLAELFDVRTRRHGRRVAYRLLEESGVSEAFTFRDVRKSAFAASQWLQDAGLSDGRRILLVSEGRPEWGMSYFGVVLSGAVCIPIDVDLSAEEITNIAAAAGAEHAIVSDAHHPRLEGRGLELIRFDTLFARAHELHEVDDMRPAKRRPEDPASIIFTSGTTGRPKGVVLTHQNFAALTARLSILFDLGHTDAMLSVLPPHHTFEFSAGLLMPLAKGSSVTYLSERSPELIGKAFEETPVTALVGVPAVMESLHRKIFNRIDPLVWPVRASLLGLIRLNERLRNRTGVNLGRIVFKPVHDAFGGRLRFLVSGAAPLEPEVFSDLRGLGFAVHEGYGLTEASPVISVGWPRQVTPAGSVGWPLPGVEVKILDPDAEGVGEILASGPTIMQGYLDAPEATAETVKDGWLHTGDRGRIDEEGRLYVVGREKDVIIDTSGKNVYPDELEVIYAKHDRIEELSVVGLPAESGSGERVACLVVPKEDPDTPREVVREEIRAHFREVSAKQPFARRVKVLHIWEGELPRTSTRKVKRSLVKDELEKLERLSEAARGAEARSTNISDPVERWVRGAIGAIARKKSSEVQMDSRLVDDLGFDSLMQLELLSSLEAERPSARISADELASAGTVAEVLRLAQRDQSTHDEPKGPEKELDAAPRFPTVLNSAGKAALGLAQRMAYRSGLDIRVEGRGSIPANRNFIVASNHASHLDMGLVKHALGPFGDRMRTLAAKDYFFDDPYRRAYFENFTNLLPMDRHGSLKKSLRLATSAIRSGETLLIFPEGTRARDGVMRPFKTAIGYLCLNEKVDILPMWLGGTHDVLPVGSFLPKGRRLEVRIGDPVDHRAMQRATTGMSRSAAYRHVTAEVERRVRRLAGLPELEVEEITP